MQIRLGKVQYVIRLVDRIAWSGGSISFSVVLEIRWVATDTEVDEYWLFCSVLFSLDYFCGQIISVLDTPMLWTLPQSFPCRYGHYRGTDPSSSRFSRMYGNLSRHLLPMPSLPDFQTDKRWEKETRKQKSIGQKFQGTKLRRDKVRGLPGNLFHLHA